MITYWFSYIVLRHPKLREKFVCLPLHPPQSPLLLLPFFTHSSCHFLLPLSWRTLCNVINNNTLPSIHTWHNAALPLWHPHLSLSPVCECVWHNEKKEAWSALTQSGDSKKKLHNNRKYAYCIRTVKKSIERVFLSFVGLYLANHACWMFRKALSVVFAWKFVEIWLERILVHLRPAEKVCIHLQHTVKYSTLQCSGGRHET